MNWHIVPAKFSKEGESLLDHTAAAQRELYSTALPNLTNKLSVAH